MGMLTYGAMAGVGGEYLKQSEEQRKNDFTMLRDKRMSEMRQTEATHASELVGGREEAAREHGDKNYTAALTSNVYRDGEMVQQGSHRPNAGTAVKPDEHTIYRGNNEPTSYEQLYGEWYKMAHAKNEYGEEIRNPDIPGWEDWLNDGQVQDRYKIKPKPPGSDEPEETAEVEKPEPGFFSSLYDSVFGGDEEAADTSRGGMLTESGDAPKAEEAKENKGQALKRPLTQSAKLDPVQMYDELNAQGFGDQDIEDTIRKYFNDPTWVIPPNALK